MFRNRGKLLSVFGNKSNPYAQAYFRLNQFRSPSSQCVTNTREMFGGASNPNSNHADFNSYIYMREWLEKDLSFSPSAPPDSSELKKALVAILKKGKSSADLDENQIKLVEKALESNDIEFIEHIKQLYLDTYFTENQYNESILSFERASSVSEVDKKLKALDHPHTLAYVALLSDDPRRLSQLDRATTIVAAALELYQRFKAKNYTVYMNPNGDMDTSAYRNFFGVSTHPGDLDDFDVCKINHNANHIIVMHQGVAFEFEVYNRTGLLPAEDIKAGIAYILQSNNNHIERPSVGAMSAASRVQRKKARDLLLKSSKESLNSLETALFVVCLDDKPYPSQQAEFVYAHGYKNRYFGSTQFIIGASGEAAVIANYVNIDGTPALEVIDTIYHDSLKVKIPKASFFNLKVKELNFDMDAATVQALNADTALVLHHGRSSYTIPIGADCFKGLRLSPNISMNLIVLMAVYNINKKLPVLNHATSRRQQSNPAAQLDWSYVCPSKVLRFIRASENITSLSSHESISAENILNLFGEAVSSCRQNIYSSKRGMSPVFFVNKPRGEVFDDLCRFYLAVGEHYPAYRNYLFRAFRNEKSIDIMTSSLNLPMSIKTIGRHGTCSSVLSEFGLHILMKSDETELVFIPNRKSIDKIDSVVENMVLWINKIKMLSHSRATHEKQNDKTSSITPGKNI